MPDQTKNANAKAAAVQAAQQLEISTTGLVQYTSQGNALVIGNSYAAEIAPRLSSAGMKVQVLLTEGDEEPGLPLVQRGQRDMELQGYLGNFNVQLGEKGKPNFEVMHADVVLDLQTQASITSPIKPPGYFHADVDNELSIAAAIDALSDMQGTFEKPRFFNYDSSVCAHSNSGVEGCTACLDACPAEAIISLKDKIEVNPSLCQGGGVCATVCPTGAIRYSYPALEDTLKRVRTLIGTYLENGGANPEVAVLTEADSHHVASLPDNQLPLMVEELASVGLDVWLPALAMGASRVVLYQYEALPGVVGRLLSQQLEYAQSILEGLGYPRSSLILKTSEEALDVSVSSMPTGLKMPLARLEGKRPHIFNAVDYLFRHSSNPQSMIPLADGAPFGRIQVDKEKCTLCLACTTVCPAQAVQAGKDAPRLILHESQCVQCGICISACPENAIQKEARLIADPDQRWRTVVLNEEEPFCCITCGKPFASQSAISTIVEKLAGHEMFQTDKARRRLKMCEDCRVVDIVQDEEMMGVQEFQA